MSSFGDTELPISLEKGGTIWTLTTVHPLPWLLHEMGRVLGCLCSPSSLETGRNPGVLRMWGKVPSNTFHGAGTFPGLLGSLATRAPYSQSVPWLAFRYFPLDMTSFGGPSCKTLAPQTPRALFAGPIPFDRSEKNHLIPQSQTVYFSLKCKDVHFLILSSNPNI